MSMAYIFVLFFSFFFFFWKIVASFQRIKTAVCRVSETFPISPISTVALELLASNNATFT